MGLGDVFKSAAGAVGRAAGDVVGATENVAKATGWAATHLDDAARGVGWAATHVDDLAKGTYMVGEGMVKGTAFLASHPQYWDDAAKQIIKDQLKPQNLAITAGLIGLTVATGGLAGGAAVAAEAAEATEAIGTAAKVAKGVEEAAEVGQAAQKTGRMAKFMESAGDIKTGIQEAKGLQKVDRAMSAFGDVKGAAREAVGLSKETLIQQGRSKLAETVLPSVERGEATGIKGSLQKAAFRKIEGGYGQARPEAQSGWSSAAERVSFGKGNVERTLGAPGKAVRGRNYLHMAAHPEDIEGNLKRAAVNYATAHPAQLAKLAGKALFGGGDEEEELVQPTSTTFAPPPKTPKLDTGGEAMPSRSSRSFRSDDSGELDLGAAAQMGRVMGRGAWKGAKAAGRGAKWAYGDYQRTTGGKGWWDPTFHQGRSELEGIRSTFDWRNMNRPGIQATPGTSRYQRKQDADRNGRRGTGGNTYINYGHVGQMGEGNVGIWANGVEGFHPGQQMEQKALPAAPQYEQMRLFDPDKKPEVPGQMSLFDDSEAPAATMHVPSNMNQTQGSIANGQEEPAPPKDPYKRGQGAYGGVYRKAGGNLGGINTEPVSEEESSGYANAYFGHLQQP